MVASGARPSEVAGRGERVRHDHDPAPLALERVAVAFASERIDVAEIDGSIRVLNGPHASIDPINGLNLIKLDASSPIAVLLARFGRAPIGMTLGEDSHDLKVKTRLGLMNSEQEGVLEVQILETRKIDIWDHGLTLRLIDWSPSVHRRSVPSRGEMTQVDDAVMDHRSRQAEQGPYFQDSGPERRAVATNSVPNP